MKKAIKFLFVINLLCISVVYGQEPIITDRPDQTEAAIVVPQKSFQLESGFSFLFKGNGTQISTPNSLFRYGLFSFLELRLFNELVVDKSIPNQKNIGLSDIQFGFKLHILESKSEKTNIAFLSHVYAPSGSEGLSNGNWGSMSRFLFSHQLNDKTSLGYNLGYQYLNSQRGDLIYTLSCAHSVTSRVGLFMEVYGDVPEFETFNINGDAGITYLVKPNMQLDASYGLGFNQTFNYLSFGFCWNVAPSSNAPAPASN